MADSEPMKPEDDLCDKLTARIETAVAMRKSAREIAHSVMPIVLAYEAQARADERAKVAEELAARFSRYLPAHPGRSTADLAIETARGGA